MSDPKTSDDDRPVLVSACLLGQRCRYDGLDNRDRVLEEQLAERGERPVPFCPEEFGGLGTPRPPAWIESHGAQEVLEGRDRLVTESGEDVTQGFLDGARGARELCAREGITRAYLKERSPSCGVCETHVAGGRVQGPGVTAALLEASGIEVLGVEGRRGSAVAPPEPPIPPG